MGHHPQTGPATFAQQKGLSNDFTKENLDLWVPPSMAGAGPECSPSTKGSESPCSGRQQTNLDRAGSHSLLPVSQWLLLLRLPLSDRHRLGQAELCLWEPQQTGDPGDEAGKAPGSCSCPASPGPEQGARPRRSYLPDMQAHSLVVLAQEAGRAPRGTLAPHRCPSPACPARGAHPGSLQDGNKHLTRF